MRKKNGFTLIELLIVLAVIAALIATMTPLALNAIRRSQASKVAQNIKILANMLEVAAYVNGLTEEGAIAGANGGTITREEIARDISDNYAIVHDSEDDKVTAMIVTTDRADFGQVQRLLPAVKQGGWGDVQSRIVPHHDPDFRFIDPQSFKENYEGQVIIYEFSFKVY